MASKIPELTARAAVRDVDAEPGMLVTPGMVDDAVEKVLRGRPPAESEALIAAWASDQSSELGQMLQGSIAARASRLKAYETVSKSPVTVNYSISDDAKKEMMARHPDMDIIFNPSVHHDHALAAAERKVASVKLHSRVPAGMRYVDFGGSLLMHVEQGNLSVMVVGGIHDSKDPARDTLVNMRLRQLARSDTVRPQVRHMAQSVLAGDGKYFQRGTLEEFSGDFKVGVMSHVYDVKLTSIPAMMDRCGMKLFEGVMHYSPRFHLEDEGELESVGARFKVQDGTFMMGFVDSPSLWYTHDWNEFMHYGIDQVLTVNGTSYSYRVHERRGDSISFRLMPAGIGRFDEQTRLFNPDIPVVEVSSYDAPVSSRSSDLVSVKRRYPTDVWDRMVRAAMLDALKGTLDVNNHVLSYKNITAGHMYNGVSTISRKVGTCDVPWVVVDSALYALAHVMLFRRGVGAFVDAEMKRRAVLDSNIIELGAKTFVQALTAVVTAPFLPLKWLGDALMTSAQAMVGRLIEVAPVARYVTIKALPYSGGLVGGVDPTDATALMMRFALDNKALDDAVDKLMLEAKDEESSMPSAEHYNVNISGTDYNANVVGSAYTQSKAGDALEIPSWVPVDEPVPGAPDQYERMEQYHTQGDRTAAVQEAISCAQAEAIELETWCRGQFEKFCSGGRTPTSREVREASERNRDLDFWHVQHGVIMNSVSGNTEDDMASGGVYCPSPIQVVGPDGIKVYTHLIAVKEATYDDGRRHRVHFVMDADYTGLVLTCKDLVVFNGAQLVAGLTSALALPHLYEMGGVLGGPGCGKTHSIVKLFKRGNMVVTPLKESAKDVRAALVKAGMLSAGAAHKVVRTLDSILCAAGRSPEAAAALHSADRVLVDECFNALPGRYYAVLGLLKARTIVVFGDNRQIPPVVRANVNLMYVYMRYMHAVRRYLNFRCAPEILACFSGHYDDKLRAVRRDKGVVVLNDGVHVDIPAGRDVLLLVMNQADKNKLVRMFPAYKSSVRTTHEAQGKQADEVYLFNFETRQISDANPNYLYFKDDYVNVAISRARNKFVYAFSSTYGDKVKEWIARGSSPSLVRALTDVSTAGTAAFF